MTTDTRLLTLAQWLSPAFPIGAFAYSHGLETAIADGRITDAEGLQDWLTDVLCAGSGRADAILLANAQGGDALRVDAIARAFAASSERLTEGSRQGTAFVDTVNAVWGLDLPPLMLPVAVGAAAARMGFAAGDTCALYLHAFMGSLVSVAVRLVPLGQTEGQQVLAALTPLCTKITDQTRGLTTDDIASNTFASDVAAMRHETLSPRIFQT